MPTSNPSGAQEAAVWTVDLPASTIKISSTAQASGQVREEKDTQESEAGEHKVSVKSKAAESNRAHHLQCPLVLTSDEEEEVEPKPNARKKETADLNVATQKSQAAKRQTLIAESGSESDASESDKDSDASEDGLNADEFIAEVPRVVGKQTKAISDDEDVKMPDASPSTRQTNLKDEKNAQTHQTDVHSLFDRDGSSENNVFDKGAAGSLIDEDMAFHEAMAKAVTGIPRSRGGSSPPWSLGQDIPVPETHVDDVGDDVETHQTDVHSLFDRDGSDEDNVFDKGAAGSLIDEDMAFHEAMAKAVTGIPRSRGGALPPGQDIAVPETHADDVGDDVENVQTDVPNSPFYDEGSDEDNVVDKGAAGNLDEDMAFHEAMAKAVTGIPRSRGGSLPPGQDIAVPETHVDDVEDDIDDIGVEIKIEVDSNDTQDVSATEVEGILLNVDLASFSKKSGQEWRCQIPRPYGLPDVDWLHGCVIDLGPLSMVIEYNKDSRVYEFALIVDQTKLEELVTKLADLGDKASFTYTPANDPRTNNITIQSALAATGRTTVKALTKLGGKRAIVAAGVGAGPAMCAVTAVDILLSLYRTYRRAEVEAGLKLTGKFGQVEFEGGVSIKSLTPPTRKQVNISLTTTYPVLKKWPPFILKLLGDIEISGVLEPGDRMPHDLSLEGKLKLQLVLKLEFDPTKLLEFEWSGGPDQRGGGGGGGPGGRSRGHRGRGGGPRDRGGRGGGGGPRGGGGGRGGGPGGRGAGPEGGGTEILGEETLAMGRDTAFYLAGDAMVKTATQTTMNVSSDMMVEETTETLTQCLAENIVQAGMDTAVDKASEIMLEAATHTTINVLSEKVIEKSTEKFVEFTAEALQEEILEEAVTFESVEVFTQTMFGLL